MKDKRIIFLVLLLSLLAPGTVFAEYFALLIGVGVDQQGENRLSGPPFDVAALYRMLTDRYHIPKENVVRLVNEGARKRRILQELNNLYTKSKRGDHIFIYFSGHGVSAKTEGLGTLDLPHNSGALVPYDSDPRGDIYNQLIIGKRDLRPLISRLDKGGRMIFAMVDACYSGQSIRGLSNDGLSRSKEYKLTASERKKMLEMSGMGGIDQGGIGNVSEANDTYPYENVFYISASSEGEKAQDIRFENNPYTIDGKPHGVLTDSFLRALSDESVDTNNDGIKSYGEMYHRVKEATIALSSSLGSFKRQTPNALPESGSIYQKAFFAVSSQNSATAVAQPLSVPSKKKLRVLVDSGLSGLSLAQSADSKNGYYRIVTRDQDYTIRRPAHNLSQNSIAVFDDKDRMIISYATIAEAERALPGFLKNRSITRQLIQKQYPQSRFNVWLDLAGKQGDIILEGEELSFTIQSEKGSYFLLLNISPEGLVNIIYPYYPSEVVKTGKRESVNLTGLGEVVAPFGTEVLKLVAFRNKPQGFERFIGKENIQPGTGLYSELENLLGVRGPQRDDVSNSQDLSQHTIWVESVGR